MNFQRSHILWYLISVWRVYCVGSWVFFPGSQLHVRVLGVVRLVTQLRFWGTEGKTMETQDFRFSQMQKLYAKSSMYTLKPYTKSMMRHKQIEKETKPLLHPAFISTPPTFWHDWPTRTQHVRKALVSVKLEMKTLEMLPFSLAAAGLLGRRCWPRCHCIWTSCPSARGQSLLMTHQAVTCDPEATTGVEVCTSLHSDVLTFYKGEEAQEAKKIMVGIWKYIYCNTPWNREEKYLYRCHIIGYIECSICIICYHIYGFAFTNATFFYNNVGVDSNQLSVQQLAKWCHLKLLI